jgi:hypothetical protein
MVEKKSKTGYNAESAGNLETPIAASLCHSRSLLSFLLFIVIPVKTGIHIFVLDAGSKPAPDSIRGPA